MRIGLAMGTVILVAGCSAQTGVVPSGEGNYLVAKQAATGFPGLGNLKADALQEANQFCSSKLLVAFALDAATSMEAAHVLAKIALFIA